jgi:hypothetical protein
MNSNSSMQNSMNETIKADIENGTINVVDSDGFAFQNQASERAEGVNDEEMLNDVSKSTTNMKIIEEIKMQKITEAIQKSDVYRNLEAIPSINVRRLLPEMVSMYIQNDTSVAMTEANYNIDNELLNSVIQTVKEKRIDSPVDGIVTNNDGTRNVIESAEQVHAITGRPVNEILAEQQFMSVLSTNEMNFLKENKLEDRFLQFYEKSYLGKENQADFVQKVRDLKDIYDGIDRYYQAKRDSANTLKEEDFIDDIDVMQNRAERENLIRSLYPDRVEGDNIVDDDGNKFDIASDEATALFYKLEANKNYTFAEWKKIEESMHRSAKGYTFLNSGEKDEENNVYTGIFSVSSEYQLDLMKTFFGNDMHTEEYTEEQRKKYENTVNKIAKDHSDDPLIKEFYIDGKVDFEKARITTQKFINVYNANKVIDDIITRVEFSNDSKTIDIENLSEKDKKNVLLDIVLATREPQHREIAAMLACKIKTNDKMSASMLKNISDRRTINEDEALSLFNQLCKTDLKYDNPEFKQLVNNRLLSAENYEQIAYEEKSKYPNQNENGQEAGSDRSKEDATMKSLGEKENKKIDELKEKLEEKKANTPASVTENNLKSYFNKNVPLDGIDCANALSIKCLYVKECQRDFEKKYGRNAETPEERARMFSDIDPDSAAYAIRAFMQSNVAIFGDVLKNGNLIDVDAVEKMIDENHLKNRNGNVNIENLVRNVEYITENSREKDDRAIKILAEIQTAFNEYKESNSEYHGKENKSQIDTNNRKKEDTILKLIKSLPNNYILNSTILDGKNGQKDLLDVISKRFDKDTQKRFLQEIYDLVDSREKMELDNSKPAEKENDKYNKMLIPINGNIFRKAGRRIKLFTKGIANKLKFNINKKIPNIINKFRNKIKHKNEKNTETKINATDGLGRFYDKLNNSGLKDLLPEKVENGELPKNEKNPEITRKINAIDDLENFYDKLNNGDLKDLSPEEVDKLKQQKAVGVILGKYVTGTNQDKIVDKNGNTFSVTSPRGMSVVEERIIEEYKTFEQWKVMEDAIYETDFGKPYPDRAYGFFTDKAEVAIIKSFYKNGMNRDEPKQRQMDNFEKQLSEIATKNPDLPFVRFMKDKEGKIDVNLARIESQKFVNAYKLKKVEENINFRNIKYAKKDLDLITLNREQQEQLFADIVIASTKTEMREETTDLIKKIKLNGEPICDISKDSLVTTDEAVEIFNQYTGNNYKLDDYKFQDILQSRLINEQNYNSILNEIESSINNNEKENSINNNEESLGDSKPIKMRQPRGKGKISTSQKAIIDQIKNGKEQDTQQGANTDFVESQSYNPWKLSPEAQKIYENRLKIIRSAQQRIRETSGKQADNTETTSIDNNGKDEVIL